MGGAFVENLSERPSSWVCLGCKTKYQLPNEFYAKPINLYTEEELPAFVQEQIELDLKAGRLLLLKKTLRDLWWAAILVIVAMLPLALVLTPLPWTIPGFIVTILVFPGWWWLTRDVIKNIQKNFAK
jgi:hypothetical protein